MVRDEFIPVDLETTYLHLRTNSATGSGYMTVVGYYNDKEGLYAGGIEILFTYPVKYILVDCQKNYTTFPFSVPAEQYKHWVIEKRGYRTVMLCNSQLVLDIRASSETCNHHDYTDAWATKWGREVSKIKFLSQNETTTISYYTG